MQKKAALEEDYKTMLAEKQKEIQIAKEHAGRKIDELESELR